MNLHSRKQTCTHPGISFADPAEAQCLHTVHTPLVDAQLGLEADIVGGDTAVLGVVGIIHQVAHNLQQCPAIPESRKINNININNKY